MKKSLITLLSLIALMPATFVSAETPTAQQIKNATKEPAVFAVDTLPQTGNKDALGDVLEVLGFAVLIGLAVYISYSPIKRKLNSDKN